MLNIVRMVFVFALMPIAMASGRDWVADHRGFRDGLMQHTTLNAENDLEISVPDNAAERQGMFTSLVTDAGEGGNVAFMGWVSQEGPKTEVQAEIRAASEKYGADSTWPAWNTVRNGQDGGFAKGRYFQYRVKLTAGVAKVSPAVREIFISTQSLRERFGERKRPAVHDLTMSMMYQATLYKLHSLYGSLPYDASERGMYILRNKRDVPIEQGSYVYEPAAAEMFLPARFGSWIVMRIHPTASFSDKTLRPADTVLRAKAGMEKMGPLAPHRAINFFDEQFMQEYLTGVAAAVRYYREHNPYVIGYTIMPPEFFYDTEPWPDMTYMGGFGELALRDYCAFMARLGIAVTDWPKAPNNEISVDRNYYLWSYWRNWTAARYIARVARVVRENDPEAQVGTLCYIGDQALRGIEPAFIENNPDIDFYYSSTMFPRVPGPDGLTGGTILSYSRPITLGQSRKTNLLEYDLWSPYVDLARAETYARYAQMEHVLPVPIVFGEFPKASAPSNHLTKYHGMRGEPLTPEVLAALARNVNETRGLQQDRKQSDVAVVLPSFSLYSGLQAGNWKLMRSAQLQMHVLNLLLKAGVTFDVLTEGHVTAERLNHYKLVIVQSVAIYPWMREAFEHARANILFAGYAGTVAAPGPMQVNVQDVKSAELGISSAWLGEGHFTCLPTAGKILAGPTDLRIDAASHPIVATLPKKLARFDGSAMNGVLSPYVGDMRGEKLIVDGAGRSVLTIERNGERSWIHLGVPLFYMDQNGRDAALLDADAMQKFMENILAWSKVTYYRDLGALRVMRTERQILIENTSAEVYEGMAPTAVGKNGKNANVIKIPPQQSIMMMHDGE